VRPAAEPGLLLALAVALPVAATAFLYAELDPAPLPPPRDGVLHAPLLASRTEEPALGPALWLALAEELPEPFTRTAAWCRRHRGRALPNCRNVLTAARAAAALPPATTPAAAPGARHAR
jgi:hypothetical protein